MDRSPARLEQEVGAFIREAHPTPEQLESVMSCMRASGLSEADQVRVWHTFALNAELRRQRSRPIQDPESVKLAEARLMDAAQDLPRSETVTVVMRSLTNVLIDENVEFLSRVRERVAEICRHLRHPRGEQCVAA